MNAGRMPHAHPSDLTIFGGTASPALAAAVARALGVRLGACTIERFPDSEVHVRVLETVRGHEVFLVQSTTPPVDERLVELLVLADACRRASAARLTAVVPYFGYGRADKRQPGEREAITARVVADLLQTVGIDRVVTLDMHTPQLEGFFHIPVDGLSAVGLLADAAREELGDDAVVVAPDAGRVKMATNYAARLRCPLVVLHKRRESGTQTAVTHLVGDVRGRRCLVIDDMISTGGTIVESARALREAGARGGIVVAATHALLLDDATRKMREGGVSRVLTTDTVERPADGDDLVHVTSVAPMIARAIGLLMTDGSLGGMY